MHDLLPEQAIGWDFDGTLIDHPAARLMHRFIRATPERRHVIITFRTGGMLRDLGRDLRRYRSAPPMSAFESVHAIDHEAWEQFMMAEWQRKAGILKGPITEIEDTYVNWKGQQCRELGVPVLIDDNLPHTKPGCERYGIRLIHPDQFL